MGPKYLYFTHPLLLAPGDLTFQYFFCEMKISNASGRRISDPLDVDKIKIATDLIEQFIRWGL